MNAVRDDIASNKIMTVITSGSFGEGLEMRGSDLDMMFVLKAVEVYEDVIPRFNPNKTYFSMERDDVKTGFTQLKLEYCTCTCQDAFKYCELHNGTYFLSSERIKQKYRTKEGHIHGPCISDKNDNIDLAMCFHCKTWISPAVQWVTRSYQISNFHSMWNFHMEPHTLYVNDVEKILKSNSLVYANVSLNHCPKLVKSDIFINAITHSVLCQQSSIKYMYTPYMSKWCSGHAQLIPVDSANSNNKYRYKQYRSCLCTLLQNVYHDVAAGWLMVASLFYKTKQYNKAVHISMYSISKLTPEKLYHDMTMSDINYQSLKLQLFKKRILIDMPKIMLVDFIGFCVNSKLIPDELQIFVSNGQTSFPSTSYAHFLNFLCHYHLENDSQCHDSFQDLQLVIKEHYLITEKREGAAYILLNVALQLLAISSRMTYECCSTY
ncbi:unnamed protein product [Mytilus coruscus]|uniref:Mab-21-like HhH/H2TH-like domain-containing protein n=1 Tax=Mytilus coruscus TaxID=42192 RepID=A0A6J8DV40_MYTCO|nr:unnamed protein product [Mytilus coruscus]